MSDCISHSTRHHISDGHILNQQSGDQEIVEEYSEVYAQFWATSTVLTDINRTTGLVKQQEAAHFVGFERLYNVKSKAALCTQMYWEISHKSNLISLTKHQ